MEESVYIFEDYPIKETLSEKLKRKYLIFITVDPKSCRTQEYLKSQSVIKSEILRHTLFHQSVFHCFSRFKYVSLILCHFPNNFFLLSDTIGKFWWCLILVWRSLSFLMKSLSVMVKRMCITMQGSNLQSFFLVDICKLSQSCKIFKVLITDLIFTMNILVNFNSGYYDNAEKAIVLDRWQIARRYVSTYFIVDLISVFQLLNFLVKKMNRSWNELLPILIYFQLVQAKIDAKFDYQNCASNEYLIDFDCYHDTIELFSLLKLLQLPLFFSYLKNFLEQNNRSCFWIKIFRVSFCFQKQVFF